MLLKGPPERLHGKAFQRCPLPSLPFNRLFRRSAKGLTMNPSLRIDSLRAKLLVLYKSAAM